MNSNVKLQGEIALAHFIHSLLAGEVPDEHAVELSADYTRAYIYHSYDQSINENFSVVDFFSEGYKRLEAHCGLLKTWKDGFDGSHYPKSVAIAHDFIKQVASVFMHFRCFDRRMFCDRYRVEKNTIYDVALKFPIALQYYDIFLTLEGEASVDLADKTISVKPGAIVFIPPTCHCSIRRASHIQTWVAHHVSFLLPPEWWYLADWIEQFSEPYFLELDDDTFELFKRACVELTYRLSFEGDVEQRLSGNILENLLLRIKLATPEALKSSDSRVAQAANFMLHHIGEPFEIEDVASHVGLSSAHLRRIFRRRMGVSLTQWRGNMRIKMAADMLDKTDMSIGDIAFRVGFDDRLYFSRKFSQTMGCSASQYRQRKKVTGTSIHRTMHSLSI